MSKTTDRRYWTGWHSGKEPENQWIGYDMQGRQAFTHLILVPAGHQVEYNVRNYVFHGDKLRFVLVSERIQFIWMVNQVDGYGAKHIRLSTQLNSLLLAAS